MLLQMGLTIVFIIAGDFKSLISFSGVCNWLFYLLTVSSLLALRIREPHLERPYRTWLITPIMFSCVSLFLLFMPIFSTPLEAGFAFLFTLAGLPAYYVSQRRTSASVLFAAAFDSLYAVLPSYPGKRKSVAISLSQRRSGSGPGLSKISTLPRVSEEDGDDINEAVPMIDPVGR